jgi:hypothetical protein
MASFNFAFMMNYAKVMIELLVVRFVKFVWLVREATGALPMASVADSSRGGACLKAWLGP